MWKIRGKHRNKKGPQVLRHMCFYSGWLLLLPKNGLVSHESKNWWAIPINENGHAFHSHFFLVLLLSFWFFFGAPVTWILMWLEELGCSRDLGKSPIKQRVSEAELRVFKGDFFIIFDVHPNSQREFVRQFCHNLLNWAVQWSSRSLNSCLTTPRCSGTR